MASNVIPPTIPVTHLLALARRASVHLRAIHGQPGRLFAWGPQTLEADRVLAAIQARATEVAALLPEHATLDMGDDVQFAGDLPLPILMALVIGWVHDTVAASRAEEEWEHAIVGRDDPPQQPVRRRQVRM